MEEMGIEEINGGGGEVREKNPHRIRNVRNR